MQKVNIGLCTLGRQDQMLQWSRNTDQSVLCVLAEQQAFPIINVFMSACEPAHLTRTCVLPVLFCFFQFAHIIMIYINSWIAESKRSTCVDQRKNNNIDLQDANRHDTTVSDNDKSQEEGSRTFF